MKNILKSTTFLAITACFLWSTAFVGVKTGLNYHTPLQFAGIRFFISGILILIIFGNINKYLIELKSRWKFILLIGVLQIFIQYAFFYTGLNLVPGSLGSMIIGSSPLFIAIVAHFSCHDDKMDRLKTASFLIGVLGITIITLGRQKIEMRGELELLGIALLLTNNIIGGYSNVLIVKKSKGISPIILSSASLIIGGFMLMIVSLPLEGIPEKNFPLEYYLSLSWLSFLSAAAFSIWYSLLNRPGIKVSMLNRWKFLIPVSGAALSWLILSNESPDLLSITGMAIIASALILLNYSNRRKLKIEQNFRIN